MKQNQKLFFLVCLLSTSTVMAAIPQKSVITTSEAKTNIEKLTGVRSSNPKTIAEKALMLARQSRDQKNYILAIKRYNYIIKNFANSKEYTIALFDKSAIYKKMGFDQPATYNFKKAQLVSSAQKNPGNIKK